MPDDGVGRICFLTRVAHLSTYTCKWS